MSTHAVSRPVFVVGCGRSGTTLLYGLLARHPAFAWFSSYTQRWPARPELAALSRLFRVGWLRRRGWRSVPYPAEGHAIFDWCRGGPQPGDNAPLSETDMHTDEAVALRRVAAAHLRYQGGERFLNKNTRNTRRIRYLDAAFPDALFVHLVREPQATVASLMKVAFWPDLPIWWANDSTPTELAAAGSDPASVAAEFWRREVEQIVADLSQLDAQRSITMRYEDLVADPVAEVTRVLRFTDVEVTPAVVEALREQHIASRNVKASDPLDAEQRATVSMLVSPTGQMFGYGT